MSRKYTAKTSRSPFRRGREKGLFKLAANPRSKKLSATATEEHDWSNDVPSIKLSTAFLVILALHIALVVGVLVFRQFGGPVASDAADSQAPANASAAAAAETAASSTSAMNAVGATFRPNAAEFDGYIKHRVRSLENLDQIAGEYGVTRSALESMNKIGVDNPFRTGMLLVIPPREIRAVRPDATQLADTSTTTNAGPASGSAEVRLALPVPAPKGHAELGGEDGGVAISRAGASMAGTHTVVQGETLWGISRIYNVTPDAIMAANGIKDARSLKIGATLKIPGR